MQKIVKILRSSISIENKLKENFCLKFWKLFYGYRLVSLQYNLVPHKCTVNRCKYIYLILMVIVFRHINKIISLNFVFIYFWLLLTFLFSVSGCCWFYWPNCGLINCCVLFSFRWMFRALCHLAIARFSIDFHKAVNSRHSGPLHNASHSGSWVPFSR